MVDLKNHPGKFLNAGAAASLERMEAEFGSPFAISDAGRSVQYQQELINRWDKGGPANRPPNLYAPGRPAETGSPHVINGGQAVDFINANERAWIKRNGGKHGWRFNIDSDVVHAIYEEGRDQFRGSGSGSSAPNSTEKNQQNWVNVSQGANIAEDGIKGPATTQAYKNYQSFLRAWGYTGEIDGVWGPGTQAAHQRYYDSRQGQPAPAPAASGELSFAQIQAGLNKFGYGLAVDNVWGPKSSNALADFQSRNGLTVDRKVGPKTRAALGI